jgi:hypothetical protein
VEQAPRCIGMVPGADDTRHDIALCQLLWDRAKIALPRRGGKNHLIEVVYSLRKSALSRTSSLLPFPRLMRKSYAGNCRVSYGVDRLMKPRQTLVVLDAKWGIRLGA